MIAAGIAERLSIRVKLTTRKAFGFRTFSDVKTAFLIYHRRERRSCMTTLSKIQQLFAVYSNDEFLSGEPVLDDECASDKPRPPAARLASSSGVGIPRPTCGLPRRGRRNALRRSSERPGCGSAQGPAAATSAIAAQLVAAAEIHWSCPWGKPLSKYGWNGMERLLTYHDPSSSCVDRRNSTPRW